MGSTGAFIGRGSVSGSINELPITRGTDLESWERDMRNQNIEYALVVDKNGVPARAFSGDEHSVGIASSALDVKDAVFTHNHPDKAFGGTFSVTDLNTFSKSQWKELRVVDRQGTTYIITAGPNADREKLRNYTRSQGKFLQKTFNKSYSSALKSAKKVYKDKSGKEYIKLKTRTADGKIKTVRREPMTDAQADTYARQYAVGMYTRTYKKNLEKFGFKYTVKKSRAGANRPNTGTGYLTR